MKLDIEKLAKWSDPKPVTTSRGARLLRTAEPTPEFSAAWKADKAKMQEAGLSWSKSREGVWTVCWWIDVSSNPEAVAATNAAVEASRATDADISIPCPEGLAYLPFQRAGIKFMLQRFGDLPID